MSAATHEPGKNTATDRGTPPARPEAATITAYYGRKTGHIITKYGPGPAVHFHVGLVEPTLPIVGGSLDELRARLVASQEALLDRAATTWHSDDGPPSDLLDAGAGLGGTALHWAQRHHSRVTALTITADHVPIIDDYARQAAVQDLVTATLGDVHELDGRHRWDAAVAIESTGYMNRYEAFSAIGRALRPGGWFGIVEHVVHDPAVALRLDDRYKTRLGGIDEYHAAASNAGFRVTVDHDLTDSVVGFWTASAAWSRRALEAAHPIDRARLERSMTAHERFARLWRDHDVETHLLLLRPRSS